MNLRENVNVMILRSGKQLETPQKDNVQKEDNTIASSSHPNKPQKKVIKILIKIFNFEIIKILVPLPGIAPFSLLVIGYSYFRI